MNKAIITGRLVKDPVISYSQGQSQMQIARYTLASDRPGKDKGADFISCVAFDKSAQFAEKYMKKGHKFLITGHIQTGSYKNRDGQTVYTTDIIVESQEFADAKETAGEAPQPAPQAAPSNMGFMEIPDGLEDEGLPFD